MREKPAIGQKKRSAQAFHPAIDRANMTMVVEVKARSIGFSRFAAYQHNGQAIVCQHQLDSKQGSTLGV